MTENESECPETGQIITVKQAAEMLRVSGMTIRRLIKLGKLPAWRIAGDGPVRLNRADVEAMFVPVFTPEEREVGQ
jgi:excisionase family DNA binding protein